MSNKLIIPFITICSFALIVGAGFSAWVFTSFDSPSASIKGNITIEDGYEGVLRVKEKQFTLNLDQGGFNNLSDLSRGIIASFTNEVDLLYYNYTITNYSNLANDGLKITANSYSIKWSDDTSDVIKKYIALPSVPIDSSLNITEYNETSVKEFTSSLNFKFTYLTKPMTAAEWDDMYNQFNDETIVANITIETNIVIE